MSEKEKKSEEEYGFKSLIDFNVQYSYGMNGYKWKITIKNRTMFKQSSNPIYVSNLSEVRNILEGSLLRILNQTDWEKL